MKNKKYNTSGTAPKYHTDGTAPKYDSKTKNTTLVGQLQNMIVKQKIPHWWASSKI